MQVFFKAWDKLPNKDEPEESAEDLWNSPALVYLTLNKGHIEFSTLDLGGLEMAIMLVAKDMVLILFLLILILCILIF